ncbi:AsmA-like C-terminal region-containing protein [Rubritalea marina]|uniref:AsmA-like C-terminal region-containing protein n=1 Tax=Rubritalea marina TaxID=361055 RepID=UPI0003620602|nr:AsmA-like C-terminal region-containing protein [Rubritalea marina]
MKIFYLSRLKHFFSICIIMMVVAVMAGLSYLHEYGFSDEVGDRLAREMERYGIYLEFDHLSFYLLQGLTANNVTVYKSPKREIKVAELPSLSIHVDKSKLMRGKLKVTTVSLSDAQLSVPLAIGADDSPVINIANVTGSIDLPGARSLRTTSLVGQFQGIDIEVSCNIWSDGLTEVKPIGPEQVQKRYRQYQEVLDFIQRFKWSESTPPKLQFFIEGNASKPEQIEIDCTLEAQEIDYKRYSMDDLIVVGDFHQNLVTIDQFKFSHEGDSCALTADYDLTQHAGRFRIDSSIHLQEFAYEVFEKRVATDLRSAGKTSLSAEGFFVLPKTAVEKLSLEMTGSIESKSFSFKGTPVDHLKTDFAWNNGDLYLDDLLLKHPLGRVIGRLIIKDRMVKYKMVSSLPVEVYFPFIKGENLKHYLGKLNFTNDSYIDVHANGRMNLNDAKDWVSYGHAVLKGFSHNDVPVKYATGNYRLNGTFATFGKLTAVFDYAKYGLKKKFKGPETGTLQAEEVHFDWPSKTTKVTTLRGTAWPAPVLQLFAPSIADHLELYEFNLPPTVDCNGLVCWASGKDNIMDLTVGFTTTGVTNYNFLDADVALNDIKGSVRILPKRVLIEKLNGSAYNGKVSGYVHVTPDTLKYNADVRWSNVKLADLCRAYNIKSVDQGYLSGNFTFNGESAEARKLQGNGTVNLRDGDLFQVPLFGPLSPLIDSVLTPITKKRVVHQQARDVACNFQIKNGRIYTDSLISSTASTTFTGSGWVDLADQNLDLTIRMNFRGLMGLAEIPLKVIELPFQALKTLFTGEEVEGLKQFRGTGKIKSPQWQFTPFQPPRDRKNDPIFSTPNN